MDEAGWRLQAIGDTDKESICNTLWGLSGTWWDVELMCSLAHWTCSSCTHGLICSLFATIYINIYVCVGCILYYGQE